MRLSETMVSSRIVSIGIVVGTLVVAFLGTAGNHSAQAARQYCAPEILHDYEQVMQGLPGIASPPKSGQLPFGPTGVTIRSISLPMERGRLLAGGGSAGYTVQGPAKGVATSWHVEASVTQVDKKGSPVRNVTTVSEHIEKVSRDAVVAFVLAIPGAPGIYRYDMSFADNEGELLAKYGRYIRVVPAKVSVQVGLESSLVRPGGMLTGKIENHGTSQLSYTANYGIERQVHGAWMNVEHGPQARGFLPVQSIGAGRASGCQRIVLSRTLGPGHYRLTKVFSRNASASKQAWSLRRSAQFTIRRSRDWQRPPRPGSLVVGRDLIVQPRDNVGEKG